MKARILGGALWVVVLLCAGNAIQYANYDSALRTALPVCLVLALGFLYVGATMKLPHHTPRASEEESKSQASRELRGQRSA